MKSCHEEGVCDRNRAEIEAADPTGFSLLSSFNMPIPRDSSSIPIANTLL
eukprot:gene25829-biopygen9217